MKAQHWAARQATPAAAGGDHAVRAARLVRWRERVLPLAAPLLSLTARRTVWLDGALILLYHRVLPDAEAAGNPFAVGRSAFESQVATVTGRFEVATVGEIARRVREGGTTKGLAAFSFDDGYECTFAHAWPILRAHDAPATLFVDTARLDGERPALTAHELRAMADEGLEVGSHTVSHPMMTGLADEELARELEQSARELRVISGQGVRGFAYPFGRFGEREARLVVEAGYEYACTCRQDRTNLSGDDPLRLTRLEINDSDDARRFDRKLRGEYAGAYRTIYRLQELGA